LGFIGHFEIACLLDVRSRYGFGPAWANDAVSAANAFLVGLRFGDGRARVASAALDRDVAVRFRGGLLRRLS